MVILEFINDDIIKHFITCHHIFIPFCVVDTVTVMSHVTSCHVITFSIMFITASFISTTSHSSIVTVNQVIFTSFVVVTSVTDVISDSNTPIHTKVNFSFIIVYFCVLYYWSTGTYTIDSPSLNYYHQSCSFKFFNACVFLHDKYLFLKIMPYSKNAIAVIFLRLEDTDLP